jgi:Fe-S-cluster containining protein
MPVYECDQCGACCQAHLIIEADELDLLREPRLIEADSFFRGKSLDEALHELQEVGRCIVLAAGKRCMFLQHDCRCSIYPTRPNTCVAMEAGDEQCQEARAAHGLPPLEPASNPEVRP